MLEVGALASTAGGASAERASGLIPAFPNNAASGTPLNGVVKIKGPPAVLTKHSSVQRCSTCGTAACCWCGGPQPLTVPIGTMCDECIEELLK